MAAATYPAEPDATKALDYQSMIALTQPDRVNGDAVQHAVHPRAQKAGLDTPEGRHIQRCAELRDAYSSTVEPLWVAYFEAQQRAWPIYNAGVVASEAVRDVELAADRRAPPAVTHTGQS